MIRVEVIPTTILEIVDVSCKEKEVVRREKIEELVWKEFVLNITDPRERFACRRTWYSLL